MLEDSSEAKGKAASKEPASKEPAEKAVEIVVVVVAGVPAVARKQTTTPTLAVTWFPGKKAALPSHKAEQRSSAVRPG